MLRLSTFPSDVRSVVLAGFSTASSAVVTAADTVLSALGKLQAQVSLAAPLASPAFTGTPSLGAAIATTQTPGTNSTAVATTAFATAADAVVSLGVAANQGRNQIVNGRFMVQQRGQGPWTTAGSFTADRWQTTFYLDTDSISVVTLADADRAAIGDEYAESALQIVVAGNSGSSSYSEILQRMEDVRRLANRTVTVTFYAKASAALSLGVYLAQFFGSGGSPSAGTATSPTTFSIGTNWARYSGTFTLASTSGKTLGTNGDSSTQLAFTLSSGSIDSASLGVGVQSGTFTLWGIQLEVGTTPTALEARNIGSELSQCQRYYQTGQVYWGGYGVAASSVLAISSYATPMRWVPAVTLLVNSSSNVTSPTLAADSSGIYGSGTVTASGATVLNMTYTASAD
jgi:hypothetical protein